MTKSLILSFVSTCVLARADELRFTDVGQPFKNKNVEINWKLATNCVPASMNIYHVVATKFSPEIISNLVSLGEFKNPATVRKILSPALDGKDSFFEEEPAHKVISISPSCGRAGFFNDKVIPLPGQRETGPPADEEVLRLALNIATNLSINPSELARKPNSHEFLMWRDKRTRGGRVNGEYRKREIARGIYLYRAIDGVSFEGIGFCGGLYVNFGNDAKIAEVDFSWRELEFRGSRATATQNEIAQRLRSGKAVILIEADPTEVQRLTITNMVPHYRGYSSTEPQEWVYPFVILEATAEVGTRKLPASLACSVLRDKPAKADTN